MKTGRQPIPAVVVANADTDQGAAAARAFAPGDATVLVLVGEDAERLGELAHEIRGDATTPRTRVAICLDADVTALAEMVAELYSV